MSTHFTISEPTSGKLLIYLSGRSTVHDASPQFRAVLALLHRKIRQVEFDLTGIDHVNNIAGRYLDLAKHIKGRSLRTVLLRLPENIARDLTTIAPNRRTISINGVKIELTPPALMSSGLTQPAQNPPETPFQPKEFLSCMGKIRHISEDSITVSLFVKNSEVIGELHRAQFPNAKLDPGVVFQYKAEVVAEGKTETNISLHSEEILNTNELVALYLEAKDAVPVDEY